tara:strand:+ start:1037 stop:1717 length:681 start_codon:yes stop_codon:yes gene_type:complete
MSNLESEDFKKCCEKIQSFKTSLPSVVDPASISHTAKIPFKVITYREALLHRMTELSDTAIELYKADNKAISFMLITRAAHETFSLLYVLNKKVIGVVKDNSIGDFDNYIMTHTFGYRMKENDNLPTMPNILKSIDKVDKVLEGSFRRTYEALSEYCHPNCSGVHQAYVKIDKEQVLAYIGSEYTNLPQEAYVGTLYASLMMFEEYYNDISKYMPDFIAVCESEFK